MPASTSKKNTVLLVDPDEDFLAWAKRHLKAASVEIATAAKADEALKHIAAKTPDLVLAEMHIQPFSGLELLKRIRLQDPGAIVLLTSGFPSTSAVIECMKLGAYDFVKKESLSYDLRRIVEGALSALEQTRQTNDADTDAGAAPDQPQESIIGKSEAMQDVFKLIGRVSRSDVPVLITGESGTGKEIVANAIHKFSPRAKNEFVAINCAAIPANLLESELFGHEKGAFTGAMSQRVGRFEQCDGGTLFLDEIGDMPIEVQSKILRVLQEGEFSRVGGNDSLHAEVRILAATNKDLERQVEAGKFREDLFYRLNVVRIHLPPLREREEDIIPLAEFFLRKLSAQKGGQPLQLSEDSRTLLASYDWPGNVRELENTVQRAAVLATGHVLLTKDIPLGRVPRNPHVAYGDTATGSDESTMRQAMVTLLQAASSDNEDLPLANWVERELTRHALTEAKGDHAIASKQLGVTAAALRKRIERYELTDPAAIS